MRMSRIVVVGPALDDGRASRFDVSAVRNLALAIVALLAAGGTGCSRADAPRGDRTLAEVRQGPGPAPYFVGEEFEGLALTAILGEAWPVTFVYGDCDVPFGSDGGCAPPLQIQVWPIRERPPSLISPMIECSRVTVRGAPGAFFGSDLDLYVGELTVVIFADSRGRTLRAAEALRPVAGTDAGSGGLPQPAADVDVGSLSRCG
jgi:hypothetical protein